MTTLVSYHVTSRPDRGWAILRNNQPIGLREELFDAVAFATHLAEREAGLPHYATRVAVRSEQDARRVAQWGDTCPVDHWPVSAMAL